MFENWLLLGKLEVRGKAIAVFSPHFLAALLLSASYRPTLECDNAFVTARIFTSDYLTSIILSAYSVDRVLSVWLLNAAWYADVAERTLFIMS